MAVLSPATYDELTRMTEFAVNEYDGPIAIRYPKGKEKLASVPDFEFGRAKVLSDGGDITLVTEGMMTKTALDAAKKSGRSVEVIELSTVYPVDFETIKKSVNKTGRLITLEANVSRGGVGELIFSELKCAGSAIAFPDKFIEHGQTGALLARYGLDADSVAKKIASECGGKNEA